MISLCPLESAFLCVLCERLFVHHNCIPWACLYVVRIKFTPSYCMCSLTWNQLPSLPQNSFSLPFSSISCTLFPFSCCQTWAPEFGQSCGQSAYAPSSQPAQSEGWEQRQWPQCQHRSQGRQWLGLETGPGWRRTVHHTLLHTHTPPK